MNKYSILSEIRQSVKGDFYLSYTILRNGYRPQDNRLPNRIWELKREINPLCQCGDNDYGYSKTIEEVKIRQEQFNLIISKYFPLKTINHNIDKLYKVIESYEFE